MKIENGGQRFDDDILRCKEEILRLKSVVPPFGRPPKRKSPSPAAVRQEPEPIIERAPLSVIKAHQPVIDAPLEPIEAAAESMEQTAVQTMVEEAAPQPIIQEAAFEPEPELEPEEPVHALAPVSELESEPLVEDSGILAALEAEAAKTNPAPPAPEPRLYTEPEPKLEPQSESKPELEPEPELGIESKTEPEPELEFESVSAPELESVPAPAPESKLELEPVPDSDLESESEESEIPEFNLAEQIMAAQRKIVGNRRKGPGSARFEIKELEQETQAPTADIKLPVAPTLPPPKAAPIRIVAMEAPMSPQQKVIADIVARDINRYYQTRKVS